jgi:hypothetical protein
MGLKFRPSEALLERCRAVTIPGFVDDPKSFVVDDAAVMVVPIRIPVPKQVFE